jgi:hypothetical protein
LQAAVEQVVDMLVAAVVAATEPFHVSLCVGLFLS